MSSVGTGMSASIVCFASAKGGSGKTVIGASLAIFLGALDRTVLLIDTDAATNGLTLFFLEKLNAARRDQPNEELLGILEVAEGHNEAVPFEIAAGVHLIPATYVLQQTEAMPIADFTTRLKRAISSYADRYDVIILDAQAGADFFAQTSVSLATQVVLVSEYDPISAEGVERLRQVFREVLTYDRTWVLFNKVLPEFAHSLGGFLEVARYLSPIPWDSDVVRSFVRRRLAL